MFPYPAYRMTVVSETVLYTAHYSLFTSCFANFEKTIERLMVADYQLDHFFVDSYTDENDKTLYFVSDKDTFETLFTVSIE